MSIRKLKLRRKGAPRPTDPLRIFESRTLRGSVENLWTPQSDALVQWTACRSDSEVIIEMATGGGKTLVGLLAAQAMVNESREKVLYLCSTNQLVGQTAEKAAEVGLSPAVYTSQDWTNRDAFTRCEGPCITSYAAAFNARSIFRSETVHGLVLDDAHVAVPQLRSQFTLRIGNDHPGYSAVANKFRPYFARIGKTARLDEALEGDPLALLLIPAHVFAPLAASIAALLRNLGVDDEESKTKWAWFHIGENLSNCFVALGPDGLEIAPSVPPVHAVDVYHGASRRLFLTATMPSAIDLARVFGIGEKTKVIRPSGKLGAAQRLIAFMRGTDSKHHRAQAAELIKNHKACIVVPSYSAAEHWTGTVLKSDAAESTLSDFKKTREARRLILVARFDGIDLPGDSCRVLVLSGLPRGKHLIERVTSETMRIRALRASTIATRISQSIGRIFRSNTDHGVVLLCGSDLHDWLKEPHNQAFLPTLLQQQVALGLELVRNVDEGVTDFKTLMNLLLANDPEWDEMYREHVGEYDVEEPPKISGSILAVFLAEHEGCRLLWDQHYSRAAAVFGEAARNAEAADLDTGLRGWIHHLTGLACLLDGNGEDASREFQKAYALHKALGRPLDRPADSRTRKPEPSVQAQKIAAQLRSPDKYFRRLTEVVDSLVYDRSHGPVEEALRTLGELLGLEASRPDTRGADGKKTGPDVLWLAPDRPQGAALEAKTNKRQGSEYTKKDDIGQFHDHIQWLTNNHADRTFFNRIVGRRLPVSAECNPPAALAIVPLEEFVELTGLVKEVADAALAESSARDLAVAVEQSIRTLGIKWPDCIEGLESFDATDLQSNAPTAESDP